MKDKVVFFSVIGIGISSVVTQLVFIREFLGVFFGNELVFGVILSEWLFLTGLGSYLGRLSEGIKKKTRLFISLQIILSILPLFSIFLIRVLRIWITLPGEAANLGIIFLSSFLILLPYCVVSGFLLTLVCSFFRGKGPQKIGNVYFTDSIGDIIGGLLFTFILVFLMNSFGIVTVILLINIFLAFLLSWIEDRRMLPFIILTIIGSLWFVSINPDILSLKFIFPGQEILLHKDSPYGSIVVTRTGTQLNFYENGIPWFSTQDVISREETVHYAMVQVENPRKVLLISGGISGTLDEIRKYRPERIDYVELDPMVIDIGRQFQSIPARVYMTDGRFFVKNSNERYDVIIIDLPDPENIQINRFYTLEFFQEIKRILNPNGVLSLSLYGGENYMSEESRLMNSIIYNTLKRVFKNILVIPGERNYFLASDSNLTYNISDRIKTLEVNTTYVNENYIQAKLTQERISFFLSSIQPTELNTDFNPKACFYSVLLWLRQFGSIQILMMIALIPCVFFFIKKPNPLEFAITTTGFAASGLEIVILLSFQSVYGYVYHSVGLLVTSFMIGVTIGSYYMSRRLKYVGKNFFVFLETSIFILSLTLTGLILLKEFYQTFFIFPLLAFVTGFLTGMEFPLASRLHLEKSVIKTAGNLFAYDLIGGCLGAFFIGVIFIPVFGVILTCVIIGSLNLFSGFLVYRS